MQIVLLERIAKLGQLGDVVTVKDGYARNYLLPQGKALRADKANLEAFEKQREELEARNRERKTDAEKLGENLDGATFLIIRQAGDTGQLYGSVNSRDIAALLNEQGFAVTRNLVVLDRPIKTLGLHDVTVTPHPEVVCRVVVNVARTEAEAERQAAGEDVAAPVDEAAEAEANLEEIFEEGAAPVETDEAETDEAGEEAPAEEAAPDAPQGADTAPEEDAPEADASDENKEDESSA